MSDNSNNVDESKKKDVNEKFSIKSLVENKNVRLGFGALGAITLLSIIGFAGSKLYQRYKN
jgi:hypothetical protein